MKPRHILFLLAFLIVFIILGWFFAVPDGPIGKRIEDAISSPESSGLTASIEGFRKRLLFSFNADSLDLKKAGVPLFKITDISGRINPLQFVKKELAFSISGKLGEGDIKGSFALPQGGTIKITNADLNAIDYLSQIGIESSGYISSDIVLNESTINLTFDVPDVTIRNSGSITIPFINSVNRIQGTLSINEDTVKINSVSLEGTKGYARLKGDIKRGIMNLSLELMPSAKDTTPVELMLIQKYMVSPGYYLMPLKGRFPQNGNASIIQ